ncbi:ParB/RepB/Spo0J family partition protein [Haematospirillum jordaniae]|uniref:ParB/RepB/Spo0J family partition protein n=1 Tax=Haematospirillum jordaniae TaxID=1549855 RepID=UPI0014330109|nr:ParB/RepB/Spo0J family partition protein [Haematospirillum jordaniae]NKD86275.1 ParB/RepB/Spo0J family partition protein [Haematospirillum jordaniae]
MSRKMPPRTTTGHVSSLMTSFFSGESRVSTLALTSIVPNPDQPRSFFDDDDLAALASSIHRLGLLQPVLVSAPGPDGKHILYAGERRWRACRLLGHHEIKAIIISGDPAEIALVENVVRVDLDMVELARGCERLMNRHGYTQGQVAEILGRSQSEISRTLNILSLPEDILQAVPSVSNKISKSTLFALADLGDEQAARVAWGRIVTTGMTVSELRAMKTDLNTPSAKPEQKSAKDVGTASATKVLLPALKQIARLQASPGSLGHEDIQRLHALRDALDQLLGTLPERAGHETPLCDIA